MKKTKVCSQCKKRKKLSHFTKNKAKADGLATFCRECHAKYTRRHYAENKDYYCDKAKRNRDKYRATLAKFINEKKNKPCVDCGKVFPPCAMDFDHRRDKITEVSNMRRVGMSLDQVKAEIKKCDVVCANCHRIRTYKRLGGVV